MQIEKLKEEWIRRLGLMDWRIIVMDRCAPSDFTEQECDGEVNYCEPNKEAIIHIMDERFIEKSKIRVFDKERILVHELLHLKFILLDDSDNSIQDRIVHA